MNKRIKTRILSSILLATVLFSVLSLSASALDNEIVEAPKGNVPIKCIPRSEITFNADGHYKVTCVHEPAPESQEVGVEIGGNLHDENPEYWDAYNEAILKEFENLPVYIYEDYFIAKEGAIAYYDQIGELIRVRGDYEYYSTIDQYLVDGLLQTGKYVGTYGVFSHISDTAPIDLDSKNAAAKTSESTPYRDDYRLLLQATPPQLLMRFVMEKHR